jgi:uncharacterized protein YdeI (YjbR/CyaY-like superfamily)
MERDNAFYAKDRDAWRKWLQKNHDRERFVWLIIHHKKSDTPSVYYDEAVEEALCFGWIDSKPNKRDAESFYLYFAKRNPKSKWSKINKDRVERMIKAKRMHRSGLQMIRIAKENNTWTALDEVDKLVVPPDMKRAFSKDAQAKANFENFPPSTRRGILEWILSAKKEETRKKRIDETVTLASKNIRANQYTKKAG